MLIPLPFLFSVEYTLIFYTYKPLISEWEAFGGDIILFAVTVIHTQYWR